MIVCTSLDEIVDAAASASPATYEAMLAFARANKQLALQYTNHEINAVTALSDQIAGAARLAGPAPRGPW